MKKIKILVVAPYQGMAESITSIAKTKKDIEITVQTGDLITGQKIARELAHNNYDVIISRGGTAEMIRQAVETPVVEASISVYDVLRSIKLAENYSGRFAIAGFSSITNCAQVLCDLLHYDIEIITFQSTEDVESALRRLQKSGFSLVLCDVIGSTTARKLGMHSILIPSGTESIQSALDEAVKLVQSTQYVHKQKDLFQAILTEEDNDFIIYNPSGALWFSSLPTEDSNSPLIHLLQTYRQSFLNTPHQRIEKQLGELVFTLYNRHLFYENEKYTVVTISKHKALFDSDDQGISIYNKGPESYEDFIKYYNSANSVGNVASTIVEYSKTTLPVLILGEIGTGKDRAASLLYEAGPYEKQPFYVIDCTLLNEKKWNSLLNNENSPFHNIHTTIYLKNPGALNKNQFAKLCTYMDQSDLIKQNRLIFSLVENNDSFPESNSVCNYLKNHLTCLTLHLPPLRDRPQDLASIATLYINRLNTSLGKQIVGFEPNAMELLQNFSWPQNLNQFQRIIQELVVTTKTSYISEESVATSLKRELPTMLPSTAVLPFDLSQTLNDINYQIIILVLNEEHMNKERTAKRLGISRSTLWRILKSHEE